MLWLWLERVRLRTFPLKDAFDSHVPVRDIQRRTDLREEKVTGCQNRLRALPRYRLLLRKYHRAQQQGEDTDVSHLCFCWLCDNSNV